MVITDFNPTLKKDKKKLRSKMIIRWRNRDKKKQIVWVSPRQLKKKKDQEIEW